MQADRDFAQATADRGIDGWVSCFAEDAARMQMSGGDVVRGIEAIRALDGPLLEDETVRLEWEPTDAGAFKSGDHGFTRGRYRVVESGEQPREVLAEGTYLSIWRQEAGAWKVILDTGVPDPAPEPDFLHYTVTRNPDFPPIVFFSPQVPTLTDDTVERGLT